MSRPLRICFMIDRLMPGGTESQLVQLIERLDRSIVKPYLCLLDGVSRAPAIAEPDDCPVLRLGLRGLLRPSSLAGAWRLAQFLRRERIDLLQVHFPDSTHFAVPIGRLARVPHIVRTRRSLDPAGRPIRRWLSRLCTAMAEVTLVNSEACRAAAETHDGCDPDSVVVIPNGIDLAAFTEIPPPPSEGDGGPRRIGMVANLRPVKGPDVFVRAAAIVARSHPNTLFQMAGIGDQESVERLAAELGIRGQLELKGSIRDVPTFLRGLEVAVLTSRSEGLSNALLEYMAAARPIVATAVGGNVELIEDGVHGLLAPPDDPQAVATAIDRLLNDSALAARLSANARRRAIQEHSWDAVASRYEAFCLNLVRPALQSRRRAPPTEASFVRGMAVQASSDSATDRLRLADPVAPHSEALPEKHPRCCEAGNALGADGPRSDSMAGAIVLTCHGVWDEGRGFEDLGDPGAASYAIGADRLAQALDELADRPCCTAAQLLAKADGDWRVLTFDDGYATDFEVVFPMLVSRGLGATFFITAEHVGRQHYTKAEQLREMASSGMEIGSHGLTHRYLVSMSQRDAVREIRQSKTRIEQMLGAAITSFAPVGGHFRRWMLDAAAEAGYRVFASMIPGRTIAEGGLLVLRRNHIRSNHDAAHIARLVRGDRTMLYTDWLRYSLLKLPKDVLGLPTYDRLKYWLLRGPLGPSARPAIPGGR